VDSGEGELKYFEITNMHRMVKMLEPKARLEMVTKDTFEIVTLQELESLLITNVNPKSYWGVAPTGPPHIGYYRAISKQMDLVNAGFKHKILIADMHAYLDDRKSPWEEIELRGKIYEMCFRLLGLDKNVEYIYGHTFQYSKEYVNNLYKLMPLITVTRATRAASEVCRMEDPKVSQLVYPLMQILDCVELDVDVAYGGIDQRHVYMLGRECLPLIGARKPILIFTPLGIGLSGKGKMSASKKKERLELFADPKKIEEKIASAFCPQNEVKDNPILEYVKYLIFPRIEKFVIEREKKYGGDIEFKTFDELCDQYKKGNIHPYDLKKATARYLIEILKPLRDYFEKHNDMLKVYQHEL